MKVIFLDIDGVLNTDITWKKRYLEFVNSNKIICPIDEFRVRILKKIIDKTNAKVVLFSTWSGGFKKENGKVIPSDISSNSKALGLYNLFNKYEMEIFDKISKIEFYVQNAAKIMDWVVRNDVEEYIIIEDEVDSLIKYFNDRIIDVGKYGLSEVHIEEAINMLNNNKILRK